ncbi:MAG: alpha/beta hydrolase, partial [Myxococcota bacterium]
EGMGIPNPELPRHLAMHGVARNEDGTFTWRFDNASRSFFPQRLSQLEMNKLWQRIECPTLLVRGADGSHGDPAADDRAKFVKIATELAVDGAGHWVHQDQSETFLTAIIDFLAE